LTLPHRLSLYPIYQNLPSPTVRKADALFLRLVRQLKQLRAGIWAKRAHVLDPLVRPWADDAPEGSKWYIDYRGQSPGLYSESDLANLQLRHFSNGRLKGFLDEADAIQAAAQRVSNKCARHTQDLLLAADTRVISLYTDGSHSKPDDRCGLPDLAGWGFLALERTTTITLHEQYDRVHCATSQTLYTTELPQAATTRGNSPK